LSERSEPKPSLRRLEVRQPFTDAKQLRDRTKADPRLVGYTLQAPPLVRFHPPENKH